VGEQEKLDGPGKTITPAETIAKPISVSTVGIKRALAPLCDAV
jgi:hypothetical protein